MPKIVSEETIFSATISVYSERGYVQSSMSEIAAFAGINETTLFRRFGTKAELIARALTDLLSKSPFARLGLSVDLEADLTGIVSAYRETNAAFGKAVLNLMSEVPRHPELRPAGAVLRENLGRAAMIIDAHQKAGRLVSEPPIELLNRLIAPLVMRAGYGRAFGEPSDGDGDPKAYVASFLRGAAAKHRP